MAGGARRSVEGGEEELTRRGDELTRKRRELPWVPVETDYRFEAEDGTKGLADLSDGRSQLVVFHFMFGPPLPRWGAVRVVALLDRQRPGSAGSPLWRGQGHPLFARLPVRRSRGCAAFQERMGWGIEWVSSGGSDFNRDLGFLHTEQELKPFLEGEIPPTVEENARGCGTDSPDMSPRGRG